MNLSLLRSALLFFALIFLLPVQDAFADCHHTAHLDKNIRVYLFHTDDLANPILATDQVSLFKANYNSEVWFVLKIQNAAGAVSYYRGRVLCPKVCGSRYGDLNESQIGCCQRLVPVPDGEVASLITPQTPGLVNSIPLPSDFVSEISWRTRIYVQVRFMKANLLHLRFEDKLRFFLNNETGTVIHELYMDADGIVCRDNCLW